MQTSMEFKGSIYFCHPVGLPTLPTLESLHYIIKIYLTDVGKFEKGHAHQIS